MDEFIQRVRDTENPEYWKDHMIELKQYCFCDDWRHWVDFLLEREHAAISESAGRETKQRLMMHREMSASTVKRVTAYG